MHIRIYILHFLTQNIRAAFACTCTKLKVQVWCCPRIFNRAEVQSAPPIQYTTAFKSLLDVPFPQIQSEIAN